MSTDQATADLGATRQVARAHPARFEDFYRATRPDIHRALSLTLRNDALAAEATDEAMVRAYQRWRTVRTHANPAGWAYRVGLNWARSWLRKVRREVAVTTDDAATDDRPADPELLDALARLPLTLRAVVVLRYFLQWSQAEVAAALDIPLGTVKSRTGQALARLRKDMEDPR